MFVEARNWTIKTYPFPQNKKVISRVGEFLIRLLSSSNKYGGLWHHFNTWMALCTCRFFHLNSRKLLTMHRNDRQTDGFVEQELNYIWASLNTAPGLFRNCSISLFPCPFSIPNCTDPTWRELKASYVKSENFLTHTLKFPCYYWWSGSVQTKEITQITIPLKSLKESKKTNSRFSSNLYLEVYHCLHNYETNLNICTCKKHRLLLTELL